MDVAARFAAEVEDLHAFFEAWFSEPTNESTRSIETMRGRLDESFWIVVPDGTKLSRDRVVAGVEGHAGDRPTTITIHDVQVSSDMARLGLVLGTYIERHERDGVVTERLATAGMVEDEDTPTGWRWLFVHETWLPHPRGSSGQPD